MCKIRRGPTIDCSRRGTTSTFVATFEADVAGGPPTTPAGGPAGVALNTTGDPGTVMVIDPSATGSKSLRIARGAIPHTRVDAEPGSLDGNRILSGVHYVDYQAYGEVIPEFLISSHSIWIEDANGDRAFTMKLYDGAYHLRVGSEFKKLGGSYDASQPHGIHIELNLDARRYSICIDEEVVAKNKTFQDGAAFTNFEMVTFWTPSTITEAFPSVYVVDDVRITT